MSLDFEEYTRCTETIGNESPLPAAVVSRILARVAALSLMGREVLFLSSASPHDLFGGELTLSSLHSSESCWRVVCFPVGPRSASPRATGGDEVKI